MSLPPPMSIDDDDWSLLWAALSCFFSFFTNFSRYSFSSIKFWRMESRKDGMWGSNVYFDTKGTLLACYYHPHKHHIIINSNIIIIITTTTTIIIININMIRTRSCRGWAVKTSDFHTGCPRFKPRPGGSVLGQGALSSLPSLLEETLSCRSHV